MARQLTVTLPPLHPAQRVIFEDRHRFRVVSKGRRFGGSLLGVVEATAEMLRGGYAWLVAPTFPNARDRWQELKTLARQIPGATIREEPLTITYQNGGQLQVKSAGLGDTLRGSGLSLLILDEFAYWEADASYLWSQVLRPMLSTTRGRALILSSPNGLGNAFHQLYGYGLDPLRTDWRSFQCRTSDNPFVAPDEIADMRAEMTADEARQELDAEFLDLTGQVFRRVAENATADPQDGAIPGHTYVIGVDLAKSLDFSAFVVTDCSLMPPAVVCLDRQGHVDYSLQVLRLKALCNRFQPGAVIVEANNVGSAVIEQMTAAGIPNLQPLTTTNATKAAQVEALSIAFENDRIRIIPDRTLLSEMGTFVASRTPGGLMKYAAAGRNHDDCVMALLLAFYGARMFNPSIVSIEPSAAADYDPALATRTSIYEGTDRRVSLVTQLDTAGIVRVIAELYEGPNDHTQTIAQLAALPYRPSEITLIQPDAGGLRAALWHRGITHTRVTVGLDEMIRQLYVLLDSSRLCIHPRCAQLIQELRADAANRAGAYAVASPHSSDNTGLLSLAQGVWWLRWEIEATAARNAQQKEPI